ncbi:transglutaminase-like domain-containing protein [Alicyclobacillus fastidiosus]|uniref:Transglutaminase family protein n=1 Tax=Alicyclobacillus fastidiosus TaxID=392011 RepID=A0ABV5AHH6_9BACL|nr:transglutaminase family protein [Alicyclobacillus fastidiosus]WEH09194.1 transglutaminase family protein [Alicyclobacillus fastidiosus]
MKIRLITSAVIAVSAVVCAASLVAQAAQQSSISESGRQVAINVQSGTNTSGIAEVTLIGPPTSQADIDDYSYTLPMQKGRIAGTLTNPWSGKTDVSVVMLGTKTIANATVTGTGPALTEQQLDLLPSYLMDSNIPTVAQQARAIASSVTTQGTSRNQAVADATMQWVKQHIQTVNQSQTARADRTLASGDGNQASQTALAVALLRADNIPAQTVQEQVTQDGMYGTSYSVQAWLDDKWLKVGTP